MAELWTDWNWFKQQTVSSRVLRKTVLRDWQFCRASEPIWRAAEVPGHIHLDLLRHGLIGDPFFRMQERDCAWVDEEDWSYRTSFEVPPSQKSVLRFEGLDTVCSVFINGDLKAEHDNMFVALEIPLDGYSGQIEVEVQFLATRSMCEDRHQRYHGMNGVKGFASFYPRAFARKAQYVFGWDWGPVLISCGIWQPVTLITYDARILNVNAVQSKLPNGDFRLAISTAIEGAGDLRHQLFGPADELVASLEGDGEITLQNPMLWWCHDLSEPNLYRLQTTLGDDGVNTTVGFRTIELVREKDEFGESFRFVLNDEPVWARGANWIPMHSFPSLAFGNPLPQDRNFPALAEWIQIARDMQMNMLRVWGGGLYESGPFYELCDRLGILVWQDFPYACSYYPDSPEWQAIAKAEAIENIKRLRNHPCLAIWCGNNENQTMWEGKWGGTDKSPERYYGENLYDKALPEALAEADPSRPYISSSPTGIEGDCNGGGVGDQHYWDVWHGRGDWRFYADSTARFSSEFGFASSPSLEVWKSCLAPEDWYPDSEAVKWHDKTLKGYDTYLGMVGLHYPEIKTLEDLHYYTQLNQRDAMRFAIEHYRCSEFCNGALIWQLNDCWPVQSWSLADFSGRLKAAGCEMERLYDPRLLSLQVIDGRLVLKAANDSGEPWSGAVELRWFGATPRKELIPFKLEKYSRSELWAEPAAVAPVLVVAETYQVKPTWTLLCEPKDYPVQDIKIEISEGLTISASGPVVDLYLYDDEGNLFEPNWITWDGSPLPVISSGVSPKVRFRSLNGKA